MSDQIRPLRSVLYIPGSKDRALDKAKSLPVDAIIFDLEDAVAPDVKVEARATLAAALGQGGYGNRMCIIRMNALDTPWGEGDACVIRDIAHNSGGCDAVLLPKVNGPADVDALVALIPEGLPIWVMIETPLAVLNAQSIAAHPRVTGFVAGTNDLAKDMNTRPAPDRAPLVTALQMMVLGGKAHGVALIDGVYNAFKDEEGLRVEVEQGLSFGFDGKTLIHPAQIDATNEIFAPTEAAIDLSRRQIEAYDAALANGEAVAVVDGKIVENLHVVTAKKVLALAEAISENNSANN